MDTSTAEDSASATATTDASPTPRLFWVGMAVFLIVIAFLGFWPTYFGPLLSGEAVGLPEGFVKSVPIVLHVHGIIMLGWMVLLLVQAVLVARGKQGTHMRLGRYGAAFGIVVLLGGLLVLLVQIRIGVQAGALTWTQAPLILWHSHVELIQFILLLGLGYGYRTTPPAHKRYMLFATMVLLTAATNRMGYLLGPWAAEIMLVPMLGPVFLYDVYNERRIRTATLIGTGVLLLFFVAKALLE